VTDRLSNENKIPPQRPDSAEAAADADSLHGSEQLLGELYQELRELARARMAREAAGGAGMTLEPTALVHEAYLRLVGDDPSGKSKQWDSPGHFFGAAALAMRRILVERARHQGRLKRGGGRDRIDFTEVLSIPDPQSATKTDLIALEEALRKLEQLDPRKGKVVTLRYFAGLTVEETAAAMDLSASTVKSEWTFARAWLHREMTGERNNLSANSPGHET
jgi:RNA polymerase sigma factor (TIGR02999 family)